MPGASANSNERRMDGMGLRCNKKIAAKIPGLDGVEMDGMGWD